MTLAGYGVHAPVGEFGIAQKVAVALEDDLMAAQPMRPCGSPSSGVEYMRSTFATEHRRHPSATGAVHQARRQGPAGQPRRPAASAVRPAASAAAISGPGETARHHGQRPRRILASVLEQYQAAARDADRISGRRAVPTGRRPCPGAPPGGDLLAARPEIPSKTPGDTTAEHPVLRDRCCRSELE